MQSEHYDAPAPDAVEDEGDSPQAVAIVEADGKRTLVGYAAVWGAISTVRADGFRHVFERGSIVWMDDAFALWNHKLDVPLAGKRNGTLRIVEDDVGARVEIDLDETTDGENALVRVVSRLIAGMSFGGIRASMTFADTSDPTVKRVTRCVAYEVSLTPTPAMKATNIVTASDSENLSSQMKDRKALIAKNKLSQLRLAIMRSR